MSNFLEGMELRKLLLGNRAEKSTGTLAATTVPLFTITGGQVGITSIYGKVTTAITVANSYVLQSNPTDGNTQVLHTATDIGTNDTPAGAILSFGAPTVALTGGTTTTVLASGLTGMLTIPIGQIESVSAGTDGVILWVVTWIPLDDGADLVAA